MAELNESGLIKMPFGLHKGKMIKEVPLNYLEWLIGQTWLKPTLKEDIETYLRNNPE